MAKKVVQSTKSLVHQAGEAIWHGTTGSVGVHYEGQDDQIAVVVNHADPLHPVVLARVSLVAPFMGHLRVDPTPDCSPEMKEKIASIAQEVQNKK